MFEKNFTWQQIFLQDRFRSTEHKTISDKTNFDKLNKWFIDGHNIERNKSEYYANIAYER